MDFKLDDIANSAMRHDAAAFDRADAVWRELAVAAGHQTDSLPSAAQVAALLNRRANPALMPSDLFHHLNELLTSTTAESAGENPARLSELLRLLKPIALAAGIAAGKGHSQTRRILSRALDVASPASMLALARASALAYGQPLSPRLEPLLKRIAHDVEAIPIEHRAAAQHALRDLVNGMIETWSAASIGLGGTGYDGLFTEQGDDEQEKERALCIAPERIIAMSFEVGALGTSVWNAVGKVGNTDQGVRQILEMVKRAPGESKAVEAVAQQFATVNRLALLLREDPIDFDAVDAVVARIPEASAGPLVDALVEAEEREVRTRLLECIAATGQAVCTLAAERLRADERWYVQRNMLRVIREAHCDIDASTLGRYARLADVRVRKEAVRLQFSDPVERDQALITALRDTDAGMLRVGLEAARESAPESIIPLIARRIQDPAFPPELKTAALHVLARSSSRLALEPLLRFVVGGSTLLGKPKLANKSPEMLIALNGLARMWSHERRAAAVLKLGHASQDPEIAQAVASPPGGPPIFETPDRFDD